MITLMTSILVCIGNLAAFQILQKAYNKELYDKSIQLLSLFAENVQSELDRVTYDSENMISDEILQRELSIMKNSGDDVKAWVDAKRGVSDRIESLDFYSEDINYVYLISTDGGRYGRFDVDNIISKYNVDELIEMAHQAKGRAVWTVLSGMEDSVVLLREVREAKDFTLDSLGTLMIKVNLADIVQRTNKTLQDVGTPIQVAIYQEADKMYASDGVVAELPLEESGYHIL